MTIAIISDIHGNFPALSAVLADIDRQDISNIICLGDTAGYYCQVNECIESLRERKIFSLMGNHDWYITSGNPCPRSNSANRCLDYQRGILTQDNIDWLKCLKPQADINKLRIVHGGWKDPLDEYLVPSQAYFDEQEGDFFASGHTHVQHLWAGKNKAYCNPGAVGQPRDGNPHAAYALFSDNGFTLKRVDYDINAIQLAMKKVGFEPFFYENLSIGARIGGKIDKLPQA